MINLDRRINLFFNNKGFAISGFLYSSLILFLTLILGMLVMATNRKIILDKEKILVLNELDSNIEDVPTLYKDQSGATIPELADGMIPIKWDGSKWI